MRSRRSASADFFGCAPGRLLFPARADGSVPAESQLQPKNTAVPRTGFPAAPASMGSFSPAARQFRFRKNRRFPSRDYSLSFCRFCYIIIKSGRSPLPLCSVTRRSHPRRGIIPTRRYGIRRSDGVLNQAPFLPDSNNLTGESGLSQYDCIRGDRVDLRYIQLKKSCRSQDAAGSRKTKERYYDPQRNRSEHSGPQKL